MCVCVSIELSRLGRSSSTSGVRQAGGDVQRQSSQPAREALNQVPFALTVTIIKCFAYCFHLIITAREDGDYEKQP